MKKQDVIRPDLSSTYCTPILPGVSQHYSHVTKGRKDKLLPREESEQYAWTQQLQGIPYITQAVLGLAVLRTVIVFSRHE